MRRTHDMRSWCLLPALVVGALAGCIDSSLVPCGDLACPVGDVCTPGGCATPTDVIACQGLADGDSCQAATGAGGTCLGGACHTGLCGNGVVDVGEACDDGNQVSGDGCRSDCLKLESCGDGVLDEGEACDDGNQNAADGCDQCTLTTWDATTVVGAEVGATSTALAAPAQVAVDGQGRIYIADTSNHRVRRVDVDGSISTIAGIGTAGFSGDGGAATSAQLAFPASVAVDGVGRVFVADAQNARIRRIDLDGTITTIAGTGSYGYAGDGGPAILASLANPVGVAVDGFGRIYVADSDNQRIRQIDIDGTISTVAGTGIEGAGGDGGQATATDLDTPSGVAIDGTGRLLIADTTNQKIRRLEADGTLTTVAGTGAIGSGGDGGQATSAQLSYPLGVAVDALDRIVIADTYNQKVRRIAADGTISTIAGDGSQGFSGDGGAGTAAELAVPSGVAVDPAGNVVIADSSNQRIRRLAIDGTIDTVAGNGTFGFGGDGGQATSAQLSDPFSVAVDAQGRVYIADTVNQRIRRIELDGTITTIAGTGVQGFSGDGGPATSALLAKPDGVAVDAAGNVYISDTYNQRIRMVDTNGIITTIAGNGTAGFSGDGGSALSAALHNPNQLAPDGNGNLYVADTYNSRIRKIVIGGSITTVAGNGTVGYSGDNGPATSAELAYPYGVAIDAQGRLVIGDTGNARVRRVELGGNIVTIAGTSTSGYSGDGGDATLAQLGSPYGIAIDGMGRVVVVDDTNQRVRRIELDGTINTIAGNGVQGSSGDAGSALSANLGLPIGVAIDPAGRIIIADTSNQRIREIDNGIITTIAGKVDPDGIGPAATGRLVDSQALVVGSTLTLSAGGTSGTLEAVRGGNVEVIAGRYPQTAATGDLARYRIATFGNVGGTAMDPTSGAIYLTESSANRLYVVSQVDPADPGTWTISPIAGAAGTAGFADGAASIARFRNPTGLYLDAPNHTLYIADTGNHAIRALDLQTNAVSTVANTSHRLGFAGDDGPATAALLYQPTAITRCPNGDLFVADTGNNRVRRIVPSTGVISTVLGDGIPASSGEGSPARTFPVDAPRGLSCDTLGNLFVTSSTAVRLVAAADDGTVDGTGAVHTIYGAPPRDTFPASVTGCLTGISVIDATTLQVADACTGLLVQLVRVPAP